MGIIGSIRKHSWIAVAVVGIAIVAFIIGDLTKNQREIPDLGKINGTTITYQHFEELTNEMEENYKRQQGVAQISADVETQLREQVWQKLLSETLIDEQYNRLGLAMTSAELSDMYLGTFIHPYLRQSFTDPQTGVYQTQAIEYYVKNLDNLDTAQRNEWMELEKTVKEDRKMQKYTTLISRGIYMPSAIAKQLADMSSKASNVYAVNLSYQSVKDEEVTLTDKDYQNYYNKHKKEFRQRDEMRELDFIVYPIAPTAADMANIQQEVEKTWAEFQATPADELTFFVNAESDRSYDSTFLKASDFASPMDSAIMAAGEGSFISPRVVGNEWMMAKVLKVDNRPDSLRASTIYIFNSKVGGNITRGDEQAKELADSVMNVVKSGAMSFEEAVAQFSDDPQKSQNNGDMEWQLDGNYGFLNEQIVSTPEGGVFVIQHPNEIGYFVVKVTGKTAPHKKYRVATIARGIVASDATTRNIYNAANKFIGNNRTHQEMIAAAQAENLQVRNAGIAAMSYSMSGIRNARSIVQWAFNEKTEKGNVCDQVFEADDMYVVAALKDIYEVGYPTLDQVRPAIENMVRLEKKAELLKARAEEAMKAGSDLRSIATKLNAVVDTIDSVSIFDAHFAGYGMEPKVQAAIAATEGNGLIGPIQGSNGVYMVQINGKVNNPNTPDAATIRTQMQQMYEMSKFVDYRMQRNNYLVVLKDNAKVVDQRNKFF